MSYAVTCERKRDRIDTDW